VKISVVVPVYNGERFLAEALVSLRRQSLPAADVVAIDDGSTDGSAAVLADFPELRVVRQPNAGCAVARNRGVALASHEIIAFLDQDDVWHPERLERSAAVLANDPTLGFVVCATENFLTPGMDAAPSWLDPRMLDVPQHGFGTCALMVRRATFDAVGPFDPTKVPVDDSEWLVRALDFGIRYDHLNDVLVRRRIHENNLTGTLRGTPAHGPAMAQILHASLKRRRASGEIS
jgi:glycosyltransferase involved in cell wall biosynthesis